MMQGNSQPVIFKYQTGNALLATEIAIPLIVIAALLIYGISPLLASLLQATAIGMLVWAALQVIRYGRGIRLYEEYLLIQGSLTGYTRRIPYPAVRGIAATQRGGIALVYHEAPQHLASEDHAPRALTELSRVGEKGGLLRQKLYISAKIAAIEDLLATLEAHTTLSLPVEVVEMLVARRRVRDSLIVLIAILLTPVYVVLLFQIF